MSETKQESELAYTRESDAPEAEHALPEAEAVAAGTSPTPDAHLKPKHRTPDSSYQNYLFGKAGSEDRPAWSDSIRGRAAIRMVSRGIVGAGFFAMGGRFARMSLEGYNPNAKPTNILQGVAKGFDMVLGAPIREAVTLTAGIKHGFGSEAAKTIGREAVTFRHTLNSGAGRSYGAEVVGFTFDFAAASVGDAATRNLLQALDPNVKKNWLVNDNGDPATHDERKHFKFDKWLQAVGTTSWRVFSKNQGEDWAAAIPYAFQMKFQRQFLNKAMGGRFEGHDIVFDNGWNGGAYKRRLIKDAAGKESWKIVGDYQLAGAIDLHARFVGYNWYTLMFREAYDSIGHTFTQWKDNGFALHAPKMPEHFNPITTPIDAIGDAARYVTKSFIKANLYMNTAVVPFWMMRVSQSKWRGKNYIDVPHEGAPTATTKTNIFSQSKNDKLAPYSWDNYEHYPEATVKDKVEKGFSKGMNWLGRWQFDLGRKAGDVAVAARSDHIAKMDSEEKYGMFEKLVTFDLKSHRSDAAKKLENGWRNFAHEYTDASLSYTPYMFAKAETALRVDDSKGNGEMGEMDKAIYNFMDNVSAFNLKGTVKSAGHILKLGTRFERDVSMREGKNVDDGTPVKPQEVPTTTVAAGNVKHENANFNRRATDVANDEHSNDNLDQSWVKAVVGDAVNPAQIHSGGATRH